MATGAMLAVKLLDFHLLGGSDSAEAEQDG
jgi:hypothetical protein